MEAQELFLSILDDAEFQLKAVFADFPPEHWETKVIDQSLSAKDTMMHLAEAYLASKKMLMGEEHQWGSYEPESTDLMGTMLALRNEVKNMAIGKGSSSFLKILEYTANHDFYHVGQMCTLRLHIDSEWNAYSIYQ